MNKLSNQLAVLLFVFAVIPTLIILNILTNMIINSKNEKLINEINFNLKQVSKNIEWQTQKISNHIKDIQTDSELQTILKTAVLKSDEKGYIRNTYDIKEIISSYLANDEDIIFAIIFGETEGHYLHGSYFPNVERIRNTDVFDKIISMDGKIVYQNKFTIGEGSDFYEGNYFLAGAVIKDITYNRNSHDLGMYAVLMPNDYFLRDMADANRNTSSIYIVMDDYGNIVMDYGNYEVNEEAKIQIYNEAMSNAEGDGEVEIGENYSLYFYNTSDVTGWKVISILPVDYFEAERRDVIVLIVIIILSSLFLVSVLSILLSRYVSNPIIKLSLAMKHVEKKDFNISVPVRSSNEIGEISKGFNQMIGEVKRLFDNLVIEEEMKRKAQLEALHYQINPHFLHNTITSIGLYAALKGADDILEMTNVLGRLLKNKISKPDILISLGEEIENIKDYIFILQIRYERRITIYYDIDENLLNAKIGSFFLQPIVENSIYHGLNSKLNLEDEEAILKISAYTDGDKVIVEVYDNGKGLTQEEIDHILDVNKEGNLKNLADGIGIQNINHRIKFMYGEKFGINIESKVGYFTKVRLILPGENN